MSWLGFINFAILQWFGVRLSVVYTLADGVSLRDAESHRWKAPYWERHAFAWLRWVWPLTGWWGEYRWIRKPQWLRAWDAS